MPPEKWQNGLSRSIGKTLGDAAIRQRADVIILGVKPLDGSLLFNPPPETPIRAGDTWIIIGSDSSSKNSNPSPPPNFLVRRIASLMDRWWC